MKLIKIVHELRKAQGTNAKLEILKSHGDNEIWKQFLVATFDSKISYHVTAPQSFDFHEADINSLMFEMLDKLSSREVSGNRARDLAKTLSYQYGEIPRLVLLHTLKAGVSFKTINKAYSGLIEVFETMKGKDTPIKKYPVLTSIKYDGVKVFAKVIEDSTTFKSSSGTIFKCKSLLNEFDNAMYGVYEGELIYREGKQKHRTTISGKLNSLIAGTKDDIDEYSYMIYDYVPLSEWDTKIGTSTFASRQLFLTAQFKSGFQDSAYVKQADHVLMGTEEEVVASFEWMIQHGYEGTMHRYEEDVYEWVGDKRTDALIKKKSIKECVLKCVGTVPHSNQLKGITGSLICEGTIKDKQAGEVFVQVKVGSGLSKMDIQYSAERYIGEDIELLYNVVTEVDGEYSLFLPRYKRIKNV